MKRELFGSGLVIVMASNIATAAPITNTFGLSSPDTTITFNEVSLANNTTLTDQFSAYGVTFSALFYDTTLLNASGLTAPVASHPACPATSCQSFDLFFTPDVNAVAFQMVSNTGPSTFAAYLNGTLVEAFTATTTIPSTTYYGFQNVVFDQLRVTGPILFGAGASIDNIEFNRAPSAVAEPASAMLFITGVGAALKRSRRRIVAARSVGNSM